MSLQSLLNIPPTSRTGSDINRLINCTESVSFFQKQSKDVHRECCRVMTLRQVQSSEKIITYGETGTDFYIILEGQVAIQVPRGKGVVSSKALEEGRKEAVILLPSLQGEEEEEDLVQISRLGAGSSFGELSLLYGQPRAATIVALTPSILAVLSQQDFNRVLKASLSTALNDKVDFLHSLDAFVRWRRPQLIRLSYYCELINICRNHVLYREGDPPESVFMVVEGEMTVPTSQFSRQMRGQAVPVLLKGCKELFGDREVVCKVPRLCTCTCTSATAALYVISRAVSCK